MEAGNVASAIDLLRESAVLYPHYKTLELLGECLIRMNRPREAIVPLAASTALNKQARAPLLLAEAFLSIGELDKAKRFAAEALTRNPRYGLASQLVAQLSADQASGFAEGEDNAGGADLPT